MREIRYFIGYPVAFIRLLVIIISMAICIAAYFVSLVFISHTPERAFKLRRVWLSFALWVLHIDVQLVGRPVHQPALYVCNHRSFTDPVILCRYLDAYVIAKAEVASYPIINKGAELTGVVWVKRENTNSRKDTRSKMIEILQDGYNVLVYPEGTVGQVKGTLPFRKGTFEEAAKFGFPVIPIACEYKSPRDLWTISHLVLFYFHQFSKWKTEVKLEFGQPFHSTSGEELHEKSYIWINEKIRNMQEGWSEAFV